MRRLTVLMLILFALPVFAQYPEVDAAVDAFMAKDLRTLAKHLPPELEKGLMGLPANERQVLSEQMIPLRMMRRQGALVKRSDSQEAVLIIEATDANAPVGRSATIKLDKRISDGSECLLRMSIQIQERGTQRFEVWMRFVDSEWRVYELQDEWGKKVMLDAPDFLAKMRHTDIDSNEAAAVGSVRSFNTAAITYASSYPDIGFPRATEDLRPPESGDVDEHHAGLLDNVLTTPPFVKNGYRFTFKGERDDYTVVARPVKFGVSGIRSFFSDQSGVIRSTDKDEEPTEKDEPLQ